LLRSPDDVWKICKFGGWNELAKSVDAKMNIMFIGRRGKVSATLISRVPIATIDDVKGLKIRSDGINGEAFNALGAQVVDMPGSEVYTALSTGLFDATDFDSVTSSYDAGFHEISDYWIQPAMTATNSHCFVANMDFWNSLSEADKTLIDITFSEIVAEMVQSAEYRSLQVLAKIQEENGITVQYWSDADVKKWKNTLLAVNTRYDDDADWVQGWNLMEEYCKQVGY